MSLPSKFWQKGDSHYTTNTEFPPPLNGLCRCIIIQNLDGGTYDVPNKISTFLRDYWTKSDGVFAEMQIISYIFIILKHIPVSSQFRKLLMLKVRLSCFGTICIRRECTVFNLWYCVDPLYNFLSVQIKSILSE